MKIEIDNDSCIFRLTDGEEDGITGQIVSYGERSILDETVPEDEQWWAEIDDEGCSDGLAHKGDSIQSEPVEFELDCEFDDEDEASEPTDAEEAIE